MSIRVIYLLSAINVPLKRRSDASVTASGWKKLDLLTKCSPPYNKSWTNVHVPPVKFRFIDTIWNSFDDVEITDSWEMDEYREDDLIRALQSWSDRSGTYRVQNTFLPFLCGLKTNEFDGWAYVQKLKLKTSDAQIGVPKFDERGMIFLKLTDSDTDTNVFLDIISDRNGYVAKLCMELHSRYHVESFRISMCKQREASMLEWNDSDEKLFYSFRADVCGEKVCGDIRIFDPDLRQFMKFADRLKLMFTYVRNLQTTLQSLSENVMVTLE